MNVIFVPLNVAGNTGCTSYPFQNATLYMAILVGALFEWGQIYFVNKGLEKFPSSFITTLETVQWGES